MGYARKALVSLSVTPYCHVVSHCVRRAWLWGFDEYAGKAALALPCARGIRTPVHQTTRTARTGLSTGVTACVDVHHRRLRRTGSASSTQL
jgi:hypothetical protein